MSKNERFAATAIPDISSIREHPSGTVQEAEHLIAWFHDALLLLLVARSTGETVLDISAWMDALLKLQISGSLEEDILLLALRMEEMLTQALRLLDYQYDSNLHAYVLKT